MAAALASYTVWLCDALSEKGTPSKSSGSELLVQVRAIQQTHFRDAGPLMAALLRRHAEIATLMYEHKLTAIRAGVSDRLASSEAVVLSEAQFGALRQLRMHCDDASTPDAGLQHVSGRLQEATCPMTKQ
jgi:hypothetical protein